MLQDHGNPMIVAGRYREANLGLAFGIQLIGPELFPFYKTILGINFSITLIIEAVVIPIVAHAMRRSHHARLAILTPLVTQFLAVTLIFILLDRGKGHVLNKWDPRKLPALKADPEDGPTATQHFRLHLPGGGNRLAAADAAMAIFDARSGRFVFARAWR